MLYVIHKFTIRILVLYAYYRRHIARSPSFPSGSENGDVPRLIQLQYTSIKPVSLDVSCWLSPTQFPLSVAVAVAALSLPYWEAATQAFQTQVK